MTATREEEKPGRRPDRGPTLPAQEKDERSEVIKERWALYRKVAVARERSRRKSGNTDTVELVREIREQAP